jgi:hypothetical protein
VDFLFDANTFDSDGDNLIGVGNATGAFNQGGDQTGVADPGLGPLGNNGGPTQTHAPLAGSSPAIDAVTGTCPPPADDQRGVARPQGPACDIGAVELQAQAPADALAALIDQVQALVQAGDLSASHGQALINKLESALKQLEKDNLQAVIAKLQAFIQQVSNFITAGFLTEAEGQPLIDAAEAVLAALSA